MSGHNQKFTPYTPAQQTGKLPSGCSKCKCAFHPETWPRSKWTASGFSPWCPQCHADFAHENPFAFNNRRAKPGPKPKPPGAPKGEPRGAAKFQSAKTHCPMGHEYTEQNTYRSKKGRVCRACRRAHVYKAKAKERGEVT